MCEISGSLHPARAFLDWYQNVSQDVKFDILDVPNKITLVKFGFLNIFVQPHDEKMSNFGMEVGDI